MLESIRSIYSMTVPTYNLKGW